MKTFITLCLLVLGSSFANAQMVNTGNIIVTIKNDKQDAIANATVELIKAKDSSLVKAAITDGNGIAELENVAFGSYLIKVTMINYVTIYSSVINIASNEKHEVRLSLIKKSGEMKEVVVDRKKPFIQKLTDRIVVNVNNSIINAGSSAMDVLERSPGVNIDQNDIISFRGKQGVIIMIDGKPTPMAGTDLANYFVVYLQMRLTILISLPTRQQNMMQPAIPESLTSI